MYYAIRHTRTYPKDDVEPVKTATCGCGKELSNRRRTCDDCKLANKKADWIRHNSGDRKKRRNVAHRYGISLEQFNAMMEECAGQCMSCGVDPASFPEITVNKGYHLLHVDHCHESGKVRGLLCHHCNLALGYAKEDSGRLRAVADYIDRVTVSDLGTVRPKK